MEGEMKIQRKGIETSKKLLAAASEVFAEKGYRDATIAEICKRAGTNVASVNYHFRNKEALYAEVWRHAFSESMKAHPPDGGVSNTAPPEERLRGQMTALLSRITDENNKEYLIGQKELANPTGLLNEVIREEIWPLQKKMESLIRELLGPHASEKQIHFSAVSIVTQCRNPIVVRRGWKKNRGDKHDPFRVDDVEAYADHVTKFSLAGIRAIREETEKTEGGSKIGRLGSKQ
jgi:TetR/AcrR family transcriptional regulator, regulator of cefoperazone and chloramphenicol sensitivity